MGRGTVASSWQTAVLPLYITQQGKVDSQRSTASLLNGLSNLGVK